MEWDASRELSYALTQPENQMPRMSAIGVPFGGIHTRRSPIARALSGPDTIQISLPKPLRKFNPSIPAAP
jgi:hypothetical protein